MARLQQQDTGNKEIGGGISDSSEESVGPLDIQNRIPLSIHELGDTLAQLKPVTQLPAQPALELPAQHSPISLPPSRNVFESPRVGIHVAVGYAAAAGYEKLVQAHGFMANLYESYPVLENAALFLESNKAPIVPFLLAAAASEAAVLWASERISDYRRR